jgi:hypothetical protein
MAQGSGHRAWGMGHGAWSMEHGAWHLKVRFRHFSGRQGDTPAHRNSVQAGRNGDKERVSTFYFRLFTFDLTLGTRPFFPLVSPSPGLLVSYFVAEFTIERSGPPSSILNPKSEIRYPKSEIRNPKSLVITPFSRGRRNPNRREAACPAHFGGEDHRR